MIKVGKAFLTSPTFSSDNSGNTELYVKYMYLDHEKIPIKVRISLVSAGVCLMACSTPGAVGAEQNELLRWYQRL